MSASRDLHIAWLAGRLAEAEQRMDALLYGQPIDLSAHARAVDLPYDVADGRWEKAGYGQVDLSADYDDDWDDVETEIFGTPEARLLAHWDALDQATPYGREATATAEISAAVKQAQADEIRRLRREVSIEATPEAELIDEWFRRTGVSR